MDYGLKEFVAYEEKVGCKVEWICGLWMFLCLGKKIVKHLGSDDPPKSWQTLKLW
jgi:hypothetical protein